jgi:hypothetical protein
MERAAGSHPQRGEAERRRNCGSAFLAGDGDECSRLLVYLLGVALRALDLALLVLVKSKGNFKRLFAFFAIIFVARHEDLRKLRTGESSISVYAWGMAASRQG